MGAFLPLPLPLPLPLCILWGGYAAIGESWDDDKRRNGLDHRQGSQGSDGGDNKKGAIRRLSHRVVFKSQEQAGDRSGQDADQRRAVDQLQTEAGDDVTLMFIQPLDGTGDDTDGGEVGERDQEHGQDPQAAR